MKLPEARILALHGFTGSGRDFELPRHAGPDAWDWETPDLPGHGARAAPPLPPPEQALDAALDIVREASVASAVPTVLLGYSMGGRIALHAAARFPGRFAAAVLVGASPGLDDPDARRRRQREDARRADRLEIDGTAPFLHSWWKLPLLATQERIPQPWLGRWRDQRLAINSPAGWAWALRHLGAGALPALWDRLPDIRLPVLLVHGAEDSKFAAIHRRMADALPRAQSVEIPDAGHTAHLENPDAFLSALAQFLKTTR